MTTTKRSTGTEDDPPEGAKPKNRSAGEDERIRREGEAESSGDAPMDPSDEQFIDSR